MSGCVGFYGCMHMRSDNQVLMMGEIAELPTVEEAVVGQHYELGW